MIVGQLISRGWLSGGCLGTQFKWKNFVDGCDAHVLFAITGQLVEDICYPALNTEIDSTSPHVPRLMCRCSEFYFAYCPMSLRLFFIIGTVSIEDLSEAMASSYMQKMPILTKDIIRR